MGTMPPTTPFLETRICSIPCPDSVAHRFAMSFLIISYVSRGGSKVDLLAKVDLRMKRVLGTACMAAVMCAVRAAPVIAKERHAIKPSARAHARHASTLSGIRGGTVAGMSLAQALDFYAPRACAYIGVITSNALYASALPAVLASRKSGSLGPFNPLPTAVMVLSVLSWLIYGLTVGNPWVRVPRSQTGRLSWRLPGVPPRQASPRASRPMCALPGGCQQSAGCSRRPAHLRRHAAAHGQGRWSADLATGHPRRRRHG